MPRKKALELWLCGGFESRLKPLSKGFLWVPKTFPVLKKVNTWRVVVVSALKIQKNVHGYENNVHVDV